jgi:hypothetical protein
MTLPQAYKEAKRKKKVRLECYLNLMEYLKDTSLPLKAMAIVIKNIEKIDIPFIYAISNKWEVK